MRSIIQDGSDERPPNEGEGAIHCNQGGVIMLDSEGCFTIADIARELGVSKTTVSRAISGKGRISEATRKRVLSFIEDNKYRPNPLAKGLANSRTYNKNKRYI